MKSKLRKPLVWFISLSVIIALYLLYIGIAGSSKIISGKEEKSAATGEIFDANLGTIEDVQVGEVEEARYFELDKQTGQVKREYGFAELLHKQGDQWQVRYPYFNIYQEKYDARITADTGEVILETALERTSPKDATFTGDVTIHIVPHTEGDFKESFIYLDDIIYTAEKSLFSTAGPVRFSSQNINMVGKGLRLIYNDSAQRVEFLRIIDLEQLRMDIGSDGRPIVSKGPEESEASAVRPVKESEASAVRPVTEKNGGTASREKPSESSPASGKSRVSTVKKRAAAGEPKQAAAAKQAGQSYRCVLVDNVIINTSDRRILADELFINNLFAGTSKEAGVAGTTTVGESARPAPTTKSKPKAGKPVHVVQSGSKHELPPSSPAQSSATSSSAALSSAAPSSAEPAADYDTVIVTCDGGIFVTPSSSNEPYGPYTRDAILPKIAKWEPGRVTDANSLSLPDSATDEVRKTTFLAHRINYDASTDDITSPGKSIVTFYPDNIAEPNERVRPVIITAQEQTRYISALRRVIFEGKCKTKLPAKTSSPGLYNILSSPQMIVDIAEQSGEPPAVSTSGRTKLTLYTDMPVSPNQPPETIPLTIIAHRRAQFLPARNKAVFEGDCLCYAETVSSNNTARRHRLSAPRLTIHLAPSPNAPDVLAMRHLTADGGSVKLSSVTGSPAKSEQQAPAGVELKCRRFDYAPGKEIFTATGPGGIIKIDNSNAQPVGKSAGKFSLERPCYGLIRDFDVLKYFRNDSKITADSKHKSINIGYVPIVKGEPGPATNVSAGHLELTLADGPGEQMKIRKLLATGGIVYQEPDIQFVGAKMLYNAVDFTVKASGDATHPALLNGIPAEGIFYNLKTGRIKSKIVAPGQLRLKQGITGKAP